jgi:hypothetical protein
VSWPETTASADDGTTVGIALPPGWWSLPVNDPDRVVHTLPGSVPGMAEELTRLARVGALTGTVLMAGGASADDRTGQVVSASLMVIADATGDADLSPGTDEGPQARLVLPAGEATRRLFLGTAPSPLGDLYELTANYAVTHARRWLLSFRTPAMAHAREMVDVFDAIAATLRIEPPAAPAGSAFG